MQTNMRRATWAFSLLALAAMSGCVVAPMDDGYAEYGYTSTTVYTDYGHPPPPRVEYRTVAPSPHHVWVAGDWFWGGSRYDWRPGRWAPPGYRPAPPPHRPMVQPPRPPHIMPPPNPRPPVVRPDDRPRPPQFRPDQPRPRPPQMRPDGGQRPPQMRPDQPRPPQARPNRPPQREDARPPRRDGEHNRGGGGPSRPERRDERR
ncbi:MAG TPA: hypothetical protein VIG85_04710 [Comamonas sp.]